MNLPAPSELASHWSLDPNVVFLNHGSFGATPTAVLDVQNDWRARMEREPVLFLHRDLEDVLDEARHRVAQFLRADPEGLVFVPNATTGVNTVLRALEFGAGDHVIVTDQEYNASRNALDFVTRDVDVTCVALPFPTSGPEEIIEKVLAAVRPNTRLLLIDHVTSQTGIVLPTPEIVAALNERGIDTLVDGAHGPGMLPLDLDAIGAAYYTGNCHKWVCSPKGSAILWVREDRRDRIRPLVISHGANSKRTDRTRYRIEHDFVGTLDPSAWLTIPAAIDFIEDLAGWDRTREHNRELVLHGRRLLCDVLGIDAPCPESMIGSLAAVPLPDRAAEDQPLFLDPTHRALFEQFAIEVPVMPWPAAPKRLLRISAQLFNSEQQYGYLADCLPQVL